MNQQTTQPSPLTPTTLSLHTTINTSTNNENNNEEQHTPPNQYRLNLVMHLANARAEEHILRQSAAPTQTQSRSSSRKFETVSSLRRKNQQFEIYNTNASLNNVLESHEPYKQQHPQMQTQTLMQTQRERNNQPHEESYRLDPARLRNRGLLFAETVHADAVIYGMKPTKIKVNSNSYSNRKSSSNGKQLRNNDKRNDKQQPKQQRTPIRQVPKFGIIENPVNADALRRRPHSASVTRSNIIGNTVLSPAMRPTSAVPTKSLGDYRINVNSDIVKQRNRPASATTRRRIGGKDGEDGISRYFTSLGFAPSDTDARPSSAYVIRRVDYTDGGGGGGVSNHDKLRPSSAAAARYYGNKSTFDDEVKAAQPFSATFTKTMANNDRTRVIEDLLNQHKQPSLSKSTTSSSSPPPSSSSAGAVSIRVPSPDAIGSHSQIVITERGSPGSIESRAIATKKEENKLRNEIRIIIKLSDLAFEALFQEKVAEDSNANAAVLHAMRAERARRISDKQKELNVFLKVKEQPRIAPREFNSNSEFQTWISDEVDPLISDVVGRLRKRVLEVRPTDLKGFVGSVFSLD